MTHSIRLLIILLCFSFSRVAAQSTSSISGKISSGNHEPVIAATVALLKTSDSSLAKVAVSDDKGNFIMQNIAFGNYSLRVSSVGYENYEKKDITIDQQNELQLPEISLAQVSTNLKEVTVTAQKPLIEVKAGKTVFNVEGSINATGSTAYELLQKSPGVVVDQNDNILLKGRGGVMVQIDGRPTQLSGSDLTDLLKSIQSSEIESIELISNPSSKYDAEGTAGIINIKLKKNKNFGTNGTVTAGYAIGIFSKYNTSLSLNNRNALMNVFGNYGNNWGNRRNELNIYRIQNDTLYDQHSNSIWSGLRHNFKGGVDFFLNKKNTLGVLVTGNLADGNGIGTSHTDISGVNTAVLTKTLNAGNLIDFNFSNINFNTNYRFADTLGHELTTDLDYGLYRNNRDAIQPNTYTSLGDSIILDEKIYHSISPTNIDIYTFKSDYTQNFLKGKLGAGIKFSWVKTDNTYDFYDVIDNMDILDETRSNNFVYTENINAAYSNYQRTIKDFDIEFGLRVEQTNSEGNLTSTTNVEDQNVKRHYFDFFPSGGITYNMSEKNSLGLSYGRRIDRPNYQELNPFEYKMDELTYRKGNPFLNPQYTDKLELSHTYNHTVTTSLSYSYTKDFFAQITDTINGNASYITTLNLAKEQITSLDISAPFNPTKWWSVYLSVSGYYLNYNANFGEGKVINTGKFVYSFYGQSTLKLPLKFSLEISGWYSSPSIWGGTYKTTDQGSLDAGLQKKLFKDRGTLKLSVTDILYSAPWSSVDSYGGLFVHAYGNWESQQFKATFSYRFGNNQVKSARQRKTGNESEAERVGNGEQ